MAARYSLAHDDTVITYNGMGVQKIERDYCLVVTNLFNRRKVKTVKRGGGLLWSNLIGNKFKVRRHNILTIDFDSPIYSVVEGQDLEIQSGVTVNFDIDTGVESEVSEAEKKKIKLQLIHELQEIYPKEDDETQEQYRAYINEQIRSERFKRKYERAIEKYRKDHFSGKYGGVQKFIGRPDAVEEMGKIIESIISLVVKNSTHNELSGGPIITIDNIPEYFDKDAEVVDEQQSSNGQIVKRTVERTPNIRQTIKEKLLYIQETFGIKNIRIVYPDVNLPKSIISAKESEKSAAIKNRQAEAQAKSLIKQEESKAQAEKIKIDVETERRKKAARAILEAVQELYPGRTLDELAPIISSLNNSNNVTIFGGRGGSSSDMDMATMLAMMNQNNNSKSNNGNNNSNGGQPSSLDETGHTK